MMNTPKDWIEQGSVGSLFDFKAVFWDLSEGRMFGNAYVEMFVRGNSFGFLNVFRVAGKRILADRMEEMSER